MNTCQNLLLDAYIQGPARFGFLAKYFRIPSAARRNLMRGSAGKITLPIMLDGQEIAIPLTCCDMGNGNTISQTNVLEIAPVRYGETYVIDSCDLDIAPFGVDEYTAASIGDQQRIISKVSIGLERMGASHDRAIELQAAQILQTAVLSLSDLKGNQVYNYEFPKKPENFPTTAATWANPLTCKPIQDIEALVAAIRTNGNCNPDTIIMNSKTYGEFANSVEVKESADLLRVHNIDLKQDPETADGRVFKGSLSAGGSTLKIYTYDKSYKDPQTGNITKYVADDKVVILSSESRFDLVPTHVSKFNPPRNDYERMMPRTLPLGEVANAIQVRPWVTQNGQSLHVETWQSCVLIPTAIYDYGCLTTA